MRKTTLSLVAISLLTLAPVFGCASTEKVSDGGNRDDDGGESDGDGGSATTGDPTGGGLGGSGGSAPEVCPEATDVFEVEPAPSNVLFLFDRSGSMHLMIDDTTTRWVAAKAGLFAFIDQLPTDTNAGIQTFPLGDDPIDCCVITWDNDIDCSYCASGELPGPATRCEDAEYSDPLVEVGKLDAARRKAIKDSISAFDQDFYWGTPLAPALAGAIGSQVAASAYGVSSVVLITDGNPTSCDTAADPSANDIQRVADAAAVGMAAATPVRTFVIGVIDGEGGTLGASEANMSLIASAGGTPRYAGCEANADCAYPVNVGNFSADLTAALDSIALQAFSCTFDLPEVTGGTPDYNAVNITVTIDNQTTTLQKDTSHANGWDYLPGKETVQVYGEACETLRSAPDAKVEVVVGCQTQGQ
jgi:hypothetical protein